MSQIEQESTRDGLVGRLRVIQAQPLDQQAAAYNALHDDLMQRLGQEIPSDAEAKTLGST